MLNIKTYVPDQIDDVGFGWPLKEKEQVMFLGGNSLHISKESKTPDAAVQQANAALEQARKAQD